MRITKLSTLRNSPMIKKNYHKIAQNNQKKEIVESLNMI